MALKAFLVGINAYADMPLNGCVNDVVETSKFLKEQCGVAEDRIRLLTDAEGTKQAIEDGLRWLMEPDGSDSKPVRLFQYSGHGTFAADEDGDEPDGRDEALVPYDYQTNGVLLDDVLCKTYAGFTPDTHLLLTMDCCHSGTIQRSLSQDRRFRFLPNDFETEKKIDEARRKYDVDKQQYVIESLLDLRTRSAPQDEWEAKIKAAMAQFDQKRFGQEEVAGNVILLSACRADQTAADARFGDPYHGALTFFLLNALRETGGRLTYNMLIDRIGKSLYDNKFLQIPQLECSVESRDCNYINLAVD
jgi:metacaspase-1